ncbi:peroxidase family protein [Nocardia sp. NPDC006630]|uniref:peroxidase family protein n=1 Tax=Nocardia sp. NPDC006630 TaxID=3157181 RepID=UPI0033A65306
MTDRSYIGRQLPPVEKLRADLPTPAETAELFRRTGPTRPAERSSALLPAWSQWFTDGFLHRGNDPDPARIDSTHIVDARPLYGHTEQTSNALRTFEGGRLKSRFIGDAEFPPLLCAGGQVKDEFAALVPVRFEQIPEANRDTLFALGGDGSNSTIGTQLFSTLFLREHNRIAGIIAGAHAGWDDERVFQTSRNVMIVLLTRVALENYVNHLTPFYFRFGLDPRRTYRGPWIQPNWVTVEYSLSYRWHSMLPSEYRIAGTTVPLSDTRTNGKLVQERGLGPLFEDLSTQSAGKLGLFNTDPSLLPIEEASISMSRELKMASYNDYREFAGLQRVTDWRQISSDQAVIAGLRDRYRSVDDIDYYVGQAAEEPAPGALWGRLMGRMFVVAAFSELLNHPLLAPRLFTPQTFSPEGMRIIESTHSFSQIVNRNTPEDKKTHLVTFGKDTPR